MIPWEFIGSARLPTGGEELRLYKRGGEFSIRVGGDELMNSRAHESEDAPADLACAKIADRPKPRVLVGGLGMGYTAAAALKPLGAAGRVVVAELAPAVVAWNRVDGPKLGIGPPESPQGKGGGFNPAWCREVHGGD